MRTLYIRKGHYSDCMKIIGPSGISKPSDLNRKRKVGDSASGFDSLLDGTSETHGASAPVATSPLDALLALQQVSDEEVSRQKGLKYGKELLEGLEEIRNGLLTGSISIDQIRRIEQLTKQQAQQFTDPALKSVLQEIEVRAAVEIAKWERFL